MQKIYFHQKPFHRERQKNTLDFASKYFEVLSPLNFENKNIDNIKIVNKRSFLYRIISSFVWKIPLLNIRKLAKKSEEADFVYTWWDIPLFPKSPFVIELDNPYVMTFYNYFAFKLYKHIIKKLLLSKKCKAITCVSEACRNTLIKELWEEIGKKAFVLYPRLKNQKKNTKTWDIIKFLFVWFWWKWKWLFDLLVAFSEIKDDKINLDIIWFKSDEVVKKYANDKRISFLWQINREEILDKMSNYDVLVFPTYFESFWMVALEALSRWLWIITTNVYALPELVKDSYNWKILKNPYLKENKNWYVEVVKMTSDHFYKKYLKTDTNENFTKQIKQALEEAVIEHKNWKENSEKIYEEKFSEKSWEKSFLDILK